jgi:soluble lytic murein transglycosylase
MPSAWCATPGATIRCRRTPKRALDLFGALLTPGDHKARMDFMLYGTEHRSRAARRQAAGRRRVALAKARIAANHKAPNAKALLEAVPRELHGDPGYIFSKIQLLRREEKFAEAAQLMLSAPKDPGRLLQSRRMVDRAAIAVAQDARHGEHPHRLSDRARRRPARARHLQDRAGIHRGLDRAALPERSRDRRPAFCPHRRRQRQPDRAGARRLLAGPRRGSRRPLAGRPRRLCRGGRAIDQLLRPAGARQARPAADRIERRAGGARRGIERLEIVRAVQLLYELDEREIAIPIFADMGENGDPDALVGLGELASRNGDARGMLLLGKAALNRGLPFDHYAYPVNGIPPFKSIGPEVEQSIVYAIAGRKAPSTRRWCRRRRPTG